MLKHTRHFWIYPERYNKNYKIRVHVTPSVKRMEEIVKLRGIENPTGVRGLHAAHTCRLFKKKGPRNGILTGDLGDIYLCAEDLTVEFISHECAHAAHNYCRRRRKTKFGGYTRTNPKTEEAYRAQHEEIYCYAQGWMTQQIVGWAVKNGFRFSK